MQEKVIGPVVLYFGDGWAFLSRKLEVGAGFEG